MTDRRRTTFPITYPQPSTRPGPRPHLPPPSQLEPSFVPQSPQVRPPYSDLPTRPNHYPNARQPTSEYTPSQDYRTNSGPSASPGRSIQGSTYSHPPLFPQKVSYQSTNPGTLYEALSPIDYMHGSSSEYPAYNDGGYAMANPYPVSNLQQHQSPASSYHSSATSSSGLATGPMHFVKSGSSTESVSQIANM